jgi:ATP adenylyltransferase
MAGEDEDEKNLIVWRAESWFVVLNLYPYNNGHMLIVPFRKVRQYTELTTEEQLELGPLIDRVMRWTGEALHPDGFNVGINQGVAGGAGIPEHLHVHVVPRWETDTNFMPSVAQVKVVPQSLHDTWLMLRSAAARLQSDDSAER